MGHNTCPGCTVQCHGSMRYMSCCSMVHSVFLGSEHNAWHPGDVAAANPWDILWVRGYRTQWGCPMWCCAELRDNMVRTCGVHGGNSGFYWCCFPRCSLCLGAVQFLVYLGWYPYCWSIDHYGNIKFSAQCSVSQVIPSCFSMNHSVISGV